MFIKVLIHNYVMPDSLLRPPAASKGWWGNCCNQWQWFTPDYVCCGQNRDGKGKKGYKGKGKEKGKVKGPTGWEPRGKGGKAARVGGGKKGVAAKGGGHTEVGDEKAEEKKKVKEEDVNDEKSWEVGEAMALLNRESQEEDLTEEGREELRKLKEEKEKLEEEQAKEEEKQKELDEKLKKNQRQQQRRKGSKGKRSWCKKMPLRRRSRLRRERKVRCQIHQNLDQR